MRYHLLMTHPIDGEAYELFARWSEVLERAAFLRDLGYRLVNWG